MAVSRSWKDGLIRPSSASKYPGTMERRRSAQRQRRRHTSMRGQAPPGKRSGPVNVTLWRPPRSAPPFVADRLQADRVKDDVGYQTEPELCQTSRCADSNRESATGAPAVEVPFPSTVV